MASSQRLVEWAKSRVGDARRRVNGSRPRRTRVQPLFTFGTLVFNPVRHHGAHRSAAGPAVQLQGLAGTRREAGPERDPGALVHALRTCVSFPRYGRGSTLMRAGRQPQLLHHRGADIRALR
jgi:hypothetical protein